MQDLSEKSESAVVEPAMADYEVTLIAQDVARALGGCMSQGQLRWLLPDICQAILRGAEQYRAWKQAEDLKLFTNRRKE